MFPIIITYLFEIIKTQCQVIQELIEQIERLTAFSKAPQSDKPTHLDYQTLMVDDLPVVKVIEKQDYRVLMAEFLKENGKPVKPVRRRAEASDVDSSLTCPCCQAPAAYLYKNNGNNGQYLCKICNQRFNQKSRFQKDIQLACPHCVKHLELIKQRQGFVIYKCRHKRCPYYQKRLKQLTCEERQRFDESPQDFKMHYLFREFALELSSLEPSSQLPTVVNLKNIHSSPKVLGLILTYYVNYGMSAEKTAALMFDVHEVRISGQTVRNYGRSVAALVQPFTDRFPYQLSNQFCGDETYIRVKGKWHYIFFFFDAVNKIILSHRVSPHRDTETAIRAIWDVLKRFDTLPDSLKLIVDGNPIYKLAEAFYAQNEVDFDVVQVIGLTNQDPVSKEYRPLKQIIERLNRTFKGNYRPLAGYGSADGSIAHVELFTTFFNFLRPHSALEKGRVPVQLPELKQCNNMPQKWIRLLGLAEDYLLSLQQEQAV